MTSSSATPSETPTSTALRESSAVTRGLSDLHLTTWILMQSSTTAIRTMIMHPLSLAASRKRVSSDPNQTVVSVIREAARLAPPSSSSSSSTTSKASVIGRTQMVRNVYRGVGIAILGNVVGEVSLLWTVEKMKEVLLRTANSAPDREAAAVTSSALSGVAGDMVALCLTAPLSVICERQLTAGYGMAKDVKYGSALETAKDVWKSGAADVNASKGTLRQRLRSRQQQAMRTFYAGAPASVAMMPAAGVWWGVYTEAKFRLYAAAAPLLECYRNAECRAQHHHGPAVILDENWLLSSKDNPLLNAVAGVMASAITSLVFTPLSVIRTRLQALPPPSASSSPSEGVAQQQSSAAIRRLNAFREWRIVRVASSLYEREGLRGFYRGASVNIGIAVLEGLMFSTLYELNKLGSDRNR